MRENKLTVWDCANSINSKSEYLGDDQEFDSAYNAFLINRKFSHTVDTLLWANEMNIRRDLSARAQYDYLFHSIRPAKRYGEWAKAVDDGVEIDYIVRELRCSRSKAREYIKFLSSDDLKNLRDKYEIGITRKR